MSWTSPLTVASTIVPFSWPSTRSIMRLEIGHGLLHRLGRLQHEGQLHLAGAEQLAHGLHAVEQDVVDDLERRVALEGHVEIVFEPLLVAVDDAQLEPLLDRLGPHPGVGARGLAVGEQGHEGLQRIASRRGGGRRSGPRPPATSSGGILCSGTILLDMDDGAGQAAPHGMVEEDRVEHVPRGRVEAERDVGEPEDELQLGQFAPDVLDRLQRPQGRACGRPRCRCRS